MKKIMFSDAFQLTQAVLDGRKTQTRRISYDFRKHASNKVGKCVLLGNNNLTYKDGDVQVLDELRSPQYQVGEVVAIAQAYKDIACGALYDDLKEIVRNRKPETLAGWTNKMFVRADLMPHHIRISDVRVERLQDISDEDCIKEGIDKWTAQGKRYYGFFDNSKGVFSNHRTPRDAYAALIDRISGKGTWESNSYVFVYDFELVK